MPARYGFATSSKEYRMACYMVPTYIMEIRHPQLYTSNFGKSNTVRVVFNLEDLVWQE